MWRSHALHARGDLAGAEEQARRTVENTRMWGFGDAGSLTFLDGILATILVARGDVEGARAVLGGPWDMPGHEGVRFWRMARLEVLAAAGEDAAAVAAAEEIAARAPGGHEPRGRAVALARRARARAARPAATRRWRSPARSWSSPGAWGAPGALGRALRVLGTLELDDDAAAGPRPARGGRRGARRVARAAGARPRARRAGRRAAPGAPAGRRARAAAPRARARGRLLGRRGWPSTCARSSTPPAPGRAPTPARAPPR